MKFIVYTYLCLLIAPSVVGQNLFTTATKTWNTTNTNFSTTTGGTESTAWSSGRIAQLDATPAITISGFNPRVFGIINTSSGSLASTASEILYLSGNTTPSINVSTVQTFSLSSPLAGGLGFSKDGDGTLALGQGRQVGNRFSGSINVNAGTLTFLDNSNLAANSAIRHNPVNLATGTNLMYNSNSNIADVRVGSLLGSGTITATGDPSNGIFSLLTTSSSSAATISTGIVGLTFRGAAGTTQTLTGDLTGIAGRVTINGFKFSDGTFSTNIVLSGANSNISNIASSYNIRGGRLFLNNSTNNSTSRLGNSATGQVVNFIGGGELHVLGNTSGTTQNIGNGLAKALFLNGGAVRIIAETPSGASDRTQIGFAGSALGFSLRDQPHMTVDFVGVGGTLGGNGTTDPRIVFTGGGNPHLGTANLLANTNGGTTIGWATANGNSFATWGANGVSALAFTAATTNTDLQAGSATSVIDFTPTANQTLSGNATSAVMRISPNGGTALNIGSNNISTAAIMLDGTTDFEITATTGNMLSGAGTKYVYVNNQNNILSTSSNIAAAVNPITKSGRGFLSLNSTSNQLGFSSGQNINLLDGVLRVTEASIGGGLSTDGDHTSIRFFGGILELSGGFTLSRALDFAGNANGGSFIFDGGANVIGSGGFSAINGASTVTLVTAIGGSTPATLLWNNTSWLSNGYSLLFGSLKADSRITLTNNLQLDNGVAASNNYNAREIYVNDNTSSTGDKAQLSGVISGSFNSDLLKTGPGELELNGTNTYEGNTLIHAGTLTTLTAGALPSTTTVVLLGGTLQLGATATVTDVILNSGATLNLNGNTINISGNFVNNGGTIAGTGTINFNGTSQQFIDGVALSLTASQNISLNNTTGLAIVSNLNSLGNITLTSGNLTVTPTASITGNYAGISGTGLLTLQAPISGQRGWRVMANPFATDHTLSTVATNNGITINTNAGNSPTGITDARIFLSMNNAWANLASTVDQFTNAYALFIRGLANEVTGLNYTAGPTPFTFNLTGTLRSTYTHAPLSVTNPIIVGNPYAGPINTQALTDGVSKPYFYYQISVGGTEALRRQRSGSWISVTASDNTTTIPMLGALAFTSVGNSFVIPTSSINTSGTPVTQVFNNSSNSIKALGLSIEQNNMLLDRLYVRQGTSNIEKLAKLKNDIVNMYLVANDGKILAIESLPNLQGKQIVGITAPRGSYTITVNENSLPQNTTATLVDKYLQTETVLTANTKYSFDVTADAASQGDNRFEIVFNQTNTATIVAETVNSNKAFSVKVLGNVGNGNIQLQLQNATNNKATLTVTDVQGRTISTKTIINGNNSISLPTTKGLYLLEINDGQNRVVEKLIR